MSDKITQEWNGRAAALLVGRTIVKVDYMTHGEADECGWYHRPVMIELDDGTIIFPAADDEGNNGGALFTNSLDEPVFPVLGG